MTTKEMSYQYRLTQWSELVQERVELGLSIRSYCAKKGFAENTYNVINVDETYCRVMTSLDRLGKLG